jgi:hypothetical protein
MLFGHLVIHEISLKSTKGLAFLKKKIRGKSRQQEKSWPVDLLEEFEKYIKNAGWLAGWLAGAAALTQHPQTHNVPPNFPVSRPLNLTNSYSKTPGTVFQPLELHWVGRSLVALPYLPSAYLPSRYQMGHNG